jgi:hypothetical protein
MRNRGKLETIAREIKKEWENGKEREREREEKQRDREREKEEKKLIGKRGIGRIDRDTKTI